MTTPVVVVSPAGDSFDVIPDGAAVAASAAVELVVQADRSPLWPALARRTVEAHPHCACCPATADLQVHHLTPVHVYRGLELDPLNLLVLCRRCHLFVGHFADWRSWNATARHDAATWRKRIAARPY